MITARLKRRKPAKMGLRESSVIRCPSHLQYVRGMCCAIEGRNGHVCFGKIQAAHVRIGTNGGTSMKPGDNWTIPLCAGAHGEQHLIGEETFEKRYGIGMKKLAEEQWLLSPAGQRYRREQGE